MATTFSSSQVVGYLAGKYVGFKCPGLGEDLKKDAEENVAYTLKVSLLAASTVLLVSAVALTLLMKFTAALALAGLGIVFRCLVSRDLESMKEPEQREIEGQQPVQRLASMAENFMRRAVYQSPAHNILARLGIAGHENWVPDKYIFSMVAKERATASDRFVLFKNLPPVGLSYYATAKNREATQSA